MGTIDLKVRDAASGKDSGVVSVDEDALGGKIKKRLMHAAVVMYHANKRQGSANTKTRADVTGTTKKMYRQKGTGRARMGTRKSGVRVGGGRIFGPKPRSFRKDMPRKQRRAAMRSALLTKIKDDELVVVKAFGLRGIETKAAAALIKRLELDGRRLLIVTGADDNRTVYLSARNIPRVSVKRASDLNALDLLGNARVLIEQASLEDLLAGPKAKPKTEEPKAEEPKAAKAADKPKAEEPKAADKPEEDKPEEDEGA